MPRLTNQFPPDHDGDSQMRASSSDEDSDTMFPTANEPAPAGPDPALSEPLASPPTSQDPPDPIGVSSQADVMDFTESANANIGGNGFDHPGSGTAGSAGGIQKPQAKMGGFGGEWEMAKEKEPGYAWTNKKARDEYHRAMEQVVDKSFNLSKTFKTPHSGAKTYADVTEDFGDPFDERGMSAEGR